MIHDLPWYMVPNNLLAVIFFLYISGFLISTICFHGFMTKQKLESGKGTKLTSKESFYWLLFSVFWFLFGFVVFYYLLKSTFTNTENQNDKT
jgi:hypothetical protein